MHRLVVKIVASIICIYLHLCVRLGRLIARDSVWLDTWDDAQIGCLNHCRNLCVYHSQILAYIIICHFPQKSLVISGSFAQNDLQLQHICAYLVRPMARDSVWVWYDLDAWDYAQFGWLNHLCVCTLSHALLSYIFMYMNVYIYAWIYVYVYINMFIYIYI